MKITQAALRASLEKFDEEKDLSDTEREVVAQYMLGNIEIKPYPNKKVVRGFTLAEAYEERAALEKASSEYSKSQGCIPQYPGPIIRGVPMDHSSLMRPIPAKSETEEILNEATKSESDAKADETESEKDRLIQDSRSKLTTQQLALFDCMIQKKVGRLYDFDDLRCLGSTVNGTSGCRANGQKGRLPRLCSSLAA